MGGCIARCIAAPIWSCVWQPVRDGVWRVGVWCGVSRRVWAVVWCAMCRGRRIARRVEVEVDAIRFSSARSRGSIAVFVRWISITNLVYSGATPPPRKCHLRWLTPATLKRSITLEHPRHPSIDLERRHPPPGGYLPVGVGTAPGGGVGVPPDGVGISPGRRAGARPTPPTRPPRRATCPG